MLLSLNIISELVNTEGLSAKEIADRLTMSTAEIEDVEEINAHLDTVIAARIEKVMPHPNADKLTLVDLDTGSGKTRVVCGASNHKQGDIVPLALVGTKFTEEFTVNETKIRGEKSSGMLCSERELGLSDDHSGIMILPPDTVPGTGFSDLFPAWKDTRLDIDNKSITHRPDLWSHLGFAREISAIFGREMKFSLNTALEQTFKNTESLSVTIENPEACSRYSGLVVKNITIKESPDWLKAKVSSIGMRPINNIVDITNYVMAELGEPMHAFDRNKLKGGIIVRMARKGEPLKTLDGQVHELTPDDIVITDKSGPVALAGVMGGEDSEIDNNTTEIILEAANFNPVKIRKTAGRYNLRTEAAIRFEKSLDPEVCRTAIIRSYELIKKLIPEAEAVTEMVDAYPVRPQKISVNTNTGFIRRKIGSDIDDQTIRNILTSLNFEITSSGGNDLSIAVPGYRATGDISIPEDIAEEVGRVYGYDNIIPKPPYVPCMPPVKNEKRLFERQIKLILSRDHRLTEVSNYSFVGEDLLNRIRYNEDKELRLQNPISSEQDRLRRSLIPNIFSNIELNQRYYESFRIFELGRVYLKKDRKSPDLALEETMITGAVYTKNPGAPMFYSAKSIAVDLIEQLHIKNVRYEPAQKDLPPYAHPARSMSIIIDNEPAGLIFEPHPKVMENFSLKGGAAMFDLSLDRLLQSTKLENSFTELQKFPDVPFEISVLADKHTYIADIHSIIKKTNKDLIRSIDVISIYEGSPVPEGMKSISFRIIFRKKDSTLSPQQIDELQKKVVDALNKGGYKLR